MAITIRRFVLLAGLVSAWAFGAPVIWAGPAPGGGALELRSIMQELSSDMEAIVRAVAAGDMAAAGESAKRVADHRRPPAEEMQGIIKLLGADMAAFKGIDTEVHEAALRVAGAAGDGDIEEVVAGFNDVLAGCVECHERFRPRVVERFYGPAAGR